MLGGDRHFARRGAARRPGRPAASERTIGDPPPAELRRGSHSAGLLGRVGRTRPWPRGDSVPGSRSSSRASASARREGAAVGYNRVFGYYLEAGRPTLAQPTDYYQRRSRARADNRRTPGAPGLRAQADADERRTLRHAELQEYESQVRAPQEHRSPRARRSSTSCWTRSRRRPPRSGRRATRDRRPRRARCPSPRLQPNTATSGPRSSKEHAGDRRRAPPGGRAALGGAIRAERHVPRENAASSRS